MTTDAGLRWLEQFPDTEADLRHVVPRFDDSGLDALREIADALGSPHRALRPIHIAGTKGKGSSALLLDFVARGLGFRTARYTSPSLEHLGDRLALNGRPLSVDEFDRLLVEFRDLCEKTGLNDLPQRVTRFELMTLLAFWWMQRERVDLPIVECGMGGRFDATNIIESPSVVLLTSIGREHTAVLGETLREIAWHKAGIMKRGAPVVLAAQGKDETEAVQATVAEEAAQQGVSLIRTADAVEVESREDGVEVRISEKGSGPFHLPWPAEGPRLENLRSALAALHVGGYFSRWESSALKRRLEALDWPSLRLPGRLEFLSREPSIVLDAAHCPLSMRAAVGALNKTGVPAWAVCLGMNRDKLIPEVARELSALWGIRTLWCFSGNSPRATSAEELARIIRDTLPEMPWKLHAVPDLGSAIGSARAGLRPSEGLLVTGSFAHLSEARRKLAG